MLPEHSIRKHWEQDRDRLYTPHEMYFSDMRQEQEQQMHGDRQFILESKQDTVQHLRIRAFSLVVTRGSMQRMPPDLSLLEMAQGTVQ